MLNPFANDFKPFTPQPTPIPQKLEDQTKKKPDAKKRSGQQSTKPKRPNVKSESQNNGESSNTNKHKKKDTQSNHSKKGPTRDDKSRNRRKSSNHDVSTTAPPSIADQFSKEVPFIAIEAAIDPIHRIDTYPLSANVNSNRKASLVPEPKFQHGYERYIDWIDRSLKLFDTVTVVGMDKAIVDVVSLVTILYDRKIGAHDDIETFSMNPGNGKMTSCIQVKLHPYL